MPKEYLTDDFVSHALCPAGQRKINYRDTKCPGFLLEVRVSGGKTFYQCYRDGHGREIQFKIGSAAILTVKEARKRGRSVAAQALVGDDPQAERREFRQTPTLADFIRNSYLPFAVNTKRSWRTDETVLRIHVIPPLGHLHLDQVTPQCVADLLGKMERAGYATGTTNRVLVLIRYVFNMALKWAIPGAPANPTQGLATAPDVCRERFLNNEEITRLKSALHADENQVAAKAIELLVLTGGRRNEITYSKWEYIDWDKKTLLVPISKTGKPRWIKLNAEAIELLRSVPRIDNNPFVFPSPTTGRPSSSLHFPWRRIKQQAHLEGLRLHDLRHTFASLLVNNSKELYTVQKLLGHTNYKSTQRYAHLSDDTLSDAVEIVGKIFSDL